MNRESIRLGLAGAGRMGRAVIQAANDRNDVQVAGVWVHDMSSAGSLDLADSVVVSTDIERVARCADVVIDFSLPAGTAAVLDAVVTAGRPLVCGVSGLAAAQIDRLDEAAEAVAVVYDRNMSLGITVLQAIAGTAAVSLGLDFEVEIEETHHVHKVDAPSGTALKLGETVAGARNQVFSDVSWYAPNAGDNAPRPGDIVFRVERRDDVPGDHCVTFRSPTERLALSHSVTTRQVFADGALRAATWLVRQPAGRYTMRDVLFAKT